MTDDGTAQTDNSNNDGVRWLCTNWFPSPDDAEERSNQHVMTAHRRGDKLVFESVPDASRSHMVLNLTVDRNLATGTWFDSSLSEGEYEGITYSGAVQLLVSDDETKMIGKWVGIGRHEFEDGTFEPRIYTGNWQMEIV